MTADSVELVTPKAGDRVWRIRIDSGPTFASSIPLEEPTQRVVEILRKTYRAKSIRAPTGRPIYPKPIGGYPRLNSLQRSTR